MIFEHFPHVYPSLFPFFKSLCYQGSEVSPVWLCEIPLEVVDERQKFDAVVPLLNKICNKICTFKNWKTPWQSEGNLLFKIIVKFLTSVLTLW